MQLEKPLNLEKLIETCSDPSNPHWHNGWLQLLNKYKNLIYFFINKSCNSWQMARLDLQKSDVINDIFSEVLQTLQARLKSFKNRDSEQKFISWLQIICNRSTSRYLQRMLKDMLTEDGIDEFNDFRDRHSGITSWELYENIVTMLREQLKNNKHIEMDIHLFMMTTWAGFTTKQVLQHPCFSNLKVNTVEVTISRIRKKLKNIVAL